MKHLFTFLIIVICTTGLRAQSPNTISYQAIIRNADGLVVTDNISMQISILKDAADGTAVYTETHDEVETNANGLVTIKIGGGTTSDDFSEINWSDGPYFIETKTDVNGDDNYEITGTSQLMSVPYALHANVADSVVGGGSGGIQNLEEVLAVSNSANEQIKDLVNPTDAQDAATKAYVDALEGKLNALEERIKALEPPSIGDFRDGGVVFYIFQAGDPGYVAGEHHGLICSVTDLNGGASWGCSGTATNANREAIGTGSTNTADIVAACTDAGIAADLCSSSTSNGQTDWYLPSKNELIKMYENKATIDATALVNGGTVFDTGLYWSSTEFNATDAYVQSMYDGTMVNANKQLPNKVRAIRSF